MTLRKIDDKWLYMIGSAIRDKLESEDAYKVEDMPDAIESIETYPEPTGTISITQNGTQNVKDYASAEVNVPNSYSASDEGKVVDNGALVAQTSRTIDENGTYDTTTNNEVVVDVEGGSATLISKTITENGTYDPADDDADGYDEVVVNVSGGGGAKNILKGTNAPTALDGVDGDIYLQYEELPSEYTQLEYIGVEASGAYIETGVSCTSNAYFYVKSQYTANPSNNYGIFGAMASNREFVVNSYGGVSYVNAGNTRGVFTDTKLNVHEFLANADGIFIDGIDSGAVVNWANAPQNNYCIFAFDLGGTKYKTANARVYACKIWNGNTLVRKFIPVKRNSDDELGLYDIVNGVFYTNSGSGSFVGGAEVSGDKQITNTYCKVNGSWQALVGTDIDDVNTGD